MDNDKLLFSGIIGMGVLASSIVIGVETSTYATMLEPELYMNSEKPYEIVLEDYPDYFRDVSFFSFHYDRIRISMDIYEDNYFEIEVIEVPILKRMLFQFNKPVKLEFS
jgi:hypothetical protein